MAEAQQHRDKPQESFPVIRSSGFCRCCGKPLHSDNPYVTIHVECEDEAYFLSRPWIKRKSKKKPVKYDPSLL